MATPSSHPSAAQAIPAPEGISDEVRNRRQRLRRAMAHLEAGLANPVAGDPLGWQDEVRRSVLDLGLALADHTTETEADDGLLASIVDDAPRLANQVERLRKEHDTLSASTTALAEHLAAHKSGDIDRIREEGIALLSALARHRQVGSDLLYEAYMIDVGTGD